MQATGHPAPPHWNQPGFNDPDHPVVAVSWVEAQKYCQWLSDVTGDNYRLPTEAEWERAALGGVDGRLYPWGDEEPQARTDYQRRWGGEVAGPLPVGKGSRMLTGFTTCARMCMSGARTCTRPTTTLTRRATIPWGR
jgi:formylglycine-generating enzyme required for sulfatase activity